ncbi:MAG: alpha-ketoglutarate-dependent dioxygenase AlkB [Haliangiales bacterium]
MGQLDLFGPRRQAAPALPDATLQLVPDFLEPGEADQLFAVLRDRIPWRQDQICMFGNRHDVPRLHQWFADNGMSYTWSGIRMQAVPWIPELVRLQERLAESTGHHFNTALANLYRDGRDTVGWHADDEPELGTNPVIASVSLGATRDFRLRHKTRRDLAAHTIALTHGSLLLMSGATQTCWEHCVPRRQRVTEARINITFRAVTAATVS